jgi:RHS repeat-associated protein
VPVAGLTTGTAGGVHRSEWSKMQSMFGNIATDTNTAVRTRTYNYHADTNRCALAAACDGTWVYNTADQLTASPQATAYTYNSHGQVTSAARVDGKTETIGYDANDHATTIDDGTTTVTETLAPAGRVLERKVTVDATHVVTEDTVYGYDGSGDSPAYTRPAGGGNVTTYLGACVDVAGVATWEIRDGHGDVVGTTDAAAAFTANPPTDEFGVGTAPAGRLGYLGGAERFTTDASLGLIRMGARLYDPTLGRFLETDPVPGGSANNYDYVNQDPVNGFDLGGDISFCSDDYCAAPQARLQNGNLESVLEKSSTWYNDNQNQRQRYLIDRMTISNVSVKHDVFKAIGQTGEYAAIVAGIIATGGAADVAAPEAFADLATIGPDASTIGSAANCTANGWGSFSCGRSVAVTVGSLATGYFVDAASRPAAKAVIAAASVAWNALGF